MLLTDQAVDYPLGQFARVGSGLTPAQLERLRDTIGDGHIALSDQYGLPTTPAMKSLRFALMSASVCAEAVARELENADGR